MATAARDLAGALSLLLEMFGDLAIDVVVEEFVDQFDDAGLRLECYAEDFGLMVVSVWILPLLNRT